ncbi:MAG: hypothetical protein N2515_00110 [Deltaproteobacteria bacterium]|nr:hypothetical protein [Deltaproteobacteria bacterium]
MFFDKAHEFKNDRAQLQLDRWCLDCGMRHRRIRLWTSDWRFTVSSSTQCSFAGDRICDTNQPGGSCTVFDCQPDQCPDNAVCVRFRSRTPRLQILACMKRCNANSDCREGEGYRCVGPEDFADRNSAEIVDRERPNARFCAALGVP